MTRAIPLGIESGERAFKSSFQRLCRLMIPSWTETLRLSQLPGCTRCLEAEYQRPRLIGRFTGQGLNLLLDDVDYFYRKALAAGGTSVIEPESTK